MQQSPKGKKQLSDPQCEAGKALQLFARAMTMVEKFLYLGNEFVLFVRMKADKTIEEVESPSDPIHHGPKGALFETERNTKHSTEEGKKSGKQRKDGLRLSEQEIVNKQP